MGHILHRLIVELTLAHAQLIAPAPVPKGSWLRLYATQQHLAPWLRPRNHLVGRLGREKGEQAKRIASGAAE